MTVFFSCKGEGVWYVTTHYFPTFFIYDVMHDVIAVTCVVRMSSGAKTTCCAVLS